MRLLVRGMRRSEAVACHREEQDLQGYEDKLIGRGIGINAPKVRTRDKKVMPSIGI
jgi:hypothetical protein